VFNDFAVPRISHLCSMQYFLYLVTKVKSTIVFFDEDWKQSADS